MRWEGAGVMCVVGVGGVHVCRRCACVCVVGVRGSMCVGVVGGATV